MLTRAQEELLEMQVSWSFTVFYSDQLNLFFSSESECILVFFAWFIIAYRFRDLLIALASKLGWHILAE